MLTISYIQKKPNAHEESVYSNLRDGEILFSVH